MWDVASTRINLVRALQRRGKISRTSMLKYMLDKLSGDHIKSLQFATIAQQLLKDYNTVNTTCLELDHSVILSMIRTDTQLGAPITQKALTYTGYEFSLL